MDEKEELIKRIETILGLVPTSTRLVLNTLVHEDVIELTKAYVNSKDVGILCQKYEAPWNCIREAESRFENVRQGWLGAVSEVMGDEDDWWCGPCRKRVEG